MKHLKHAFATAMSLAALSGLATAEEWVATGAKAAGMGGAQVANPQGSAAISANPAALAREARFDMALPINIQVGSEGSLIESIDSLETSYKNKGVDTALASLGDSTITQADKITNIAKIVDFLAVDAAVLDKPGQGVIANVNGALTARWGRLGISVGQRVYAAATVRYDSAWKFTSTGQSLIGTGEITDAQLSALNTSAVSTTATTLADAADSGTGASTANLSAASMQYVIDQIESQTGKPVTQGSNEYNLLLAVAQQVNVANDTNASAATTASTSTTSIDNNTGVEIRGVFIKEAAIGYGFTFMEGKLHVGPALKFMQGETIASSIKLTDTTDDNKDIGDELDNDANTKSTSAFTLDLGVIYEVSDKFSLGLVGKDLTSPSFDTSSGSAIELERTIRAGAAYEYLQTPGWRGDLAFDMDLISSKSGVLIGGESRQLSFGINQEIAGFLSLRLGGVKNIDGVSTGLAYTGGLGLQISKFYLDVSASKSSDEVTVDGDDYPTRGGFAATLGWNMNF